MSIRLLLHPLVHWIVVKGISTSITEVIQFTFDNFSICGKLLNYHKFLCELSAAAGEERLSSPQRLSTEQTSMTTRVGCLIALSPLGQLRNYRSVQWGLKDERLYRNYRELLYRITIIAGGWLGKKVIARLQRTFSDVAPIVVVWTSFRSHTAP